MALAPPIPPSSPSASSPFGSVKALHRHAFDDGNERVDCGSAVVAARDGARPSFAESDEGDFSAAQAEQFLAGAPLTLGWVTRSPGRAGGESVYVYCWVTIGD